MAIRELDTFQIKGLVPHWKMLLTVITLYQIATYQNTGSKSIRLL